MAAAEGILPREAADAAENEFLLFPCSTERPRHDSMTFSQIPENEPEDKENVAVDGLALDPAYKYMIIGGAIGGFITSYQETQLAVQLHTIASDLNALDQSSWIATPYLLCEIVGPPVYAQLSNVLGRRLVLIWSIALIGLGCLLCSIAPNVWALAAARAIAGLGGSGVLTLVTAIMSDAIPLQHRGLWQSYFNASTMVGAGAGVPMGGVFLDAIGWRWSFAIQIVPVMASLSLLWSGPDIQDMPGVINISQLRLGLSRVDFSGAAAFLCAGFAFVLYVDIGSRFGWISAQAAVLALLTLLLAATFIYIESRVATHALIPLHLTLDPNFSPFFFAGFCQQSAWMGNAYQVPRYLKVVSSLSGTQIAFHLLPAPLLNTLGNFTAGFYMRWTARYKALTIVGFLLTSVSDASIFVNGLLGSTAGLIASYMGSNLFSGMPVNSLMIGQISHAADDMHATTTAAYLTIRSIGSIVGVAVCASVSNTYLRHALAQALSPEIVDRVRKSLDLSAFAPEVADTIRDCYQGAIATALSVNVAFIILALLTSMVIREKPLAAKVASAAP